MNYLQITIHYGLCMFHIAITDNDEMVGKAAVGIDHREIALMFLHYADQNFRRQVLKVSRVKTA